MGDDKILRAAEQAGLAGEAAEAILEVSSRGTGDRSANVRFYLALLGVLPWVGVMISAIANRWAEQEQMNVNALFRHWLEEHENRFAELKETVRSIEQRVAGFGPEARERLNSDEYLALVRMGFRVWDRAETPEKRDLIRKVLTNAACTRISSDDFVRRFIEWIDVYNELHFRVIKCIYATANITRAQIWRKVHGEDVAENSAEADLFKLLIRDLSTGSVIRQYRPTDAYGNFLKKGRPTTQGRGTTTMKSAFDDEEPYVLTELGDAFVRYALNEVVPRIAA
jgi:hypothetical protein